MAWGRLLPLLQLIVTVIVAAYLLHLQLSGWRSSEHVAHWVAEHRATVGPLVQVVAAVLGMLEVQALCRVLRYSLTRHALKRPVPLKKIELISAASITKLSLSAGFISGMLTLLIVVVSFVPAAVFSAALTPVQSEQNVTQRIDIPTFYTDKPVEFLPRSQGPQLNPPYFSGNNSTALPGTFGGGTYVGSQWAVKQGVFSYNIYAKAGALIDAASDASYNRYAGRPHAKPDKTGYFYSNRSYGAGAAAGFARLPEESQPRQYTYRESGFCSKVSCRYNDSMAFKLVYVGFSVEPSPASWELLTYDAKGIHPDPDRTPVVSSGLTGVFPRDIFAWTAMYPIQSREVDDKGIYISMRTGAAMDTTDPWGFMSFEKLQCRIGLEAKKFDVLVNETSKLISVSPDHSKSVPWPHYGDAVASEVSDWLYELSHTDGCVGGSKLGYALSTNLEQLRYLNGYLNDTNRKLLAASAAEDFLADAVDNILNSLVSTRHVSAGHSISSPSEITMPAVVLGNKTWAAAALAISVFAVLVYLFEAIRTRLWQGMILLDLTDMVEVISSALIGGITCESEAVLQLMPDGINGGLQVKASDGGESGRTPALRPFVSDELKEEPQCGNEPKECAIVEVTSLPDESS